MPDTLIGTYVSITSQLQVGTHPGNVCNTHVCTIHEVDTIHDSDRHNKTTVDAADDLFLLLRSKAIIFVNYVTDAQVNFAVGFDWIVEVSIAKILFLQLIGLYDLGHTGNQMWKVQIRDEGSAGRFRRVNAALASAERHEWLLGHRTTADYLE